MANTEILKMENKMIKKYWFVLSLLLMAAMLLAACATAVEPVQPTSTPVVLSGPSATKAPVQPTTTPGETSQNEDLCGGTGGIGQIVSVGDIDFTINLFADGSDMIVHLTSQAIIKTSAGFASLSDLEIGYSVTLVGDRNSDGDFKADTVVVCN